MQDMTFTFFQMIVVLIPMLIGIGSVLLIVWGAVQDDMMEPKVRFGMPFITGVWVVCALWAFWPVVAG